VPELPEVETTVRGLMPALQDRILTSVDLRRDDLRRPFPVGLRQRLTGARVIALSRRAKYGVIATDRGDSLIFHLGMSGRWRLEPDAIGPHDHVILTTDAGNRLALNDPRRFGSIDLVQSDALDSFAPFAALGPEPLGPDLSAPYLHARLSGRTAPIKAMLLDQRIVAGLGNIYVCEALNIAGIAPSRAAGRISLGSLQCLVVAIRDVLTAAIAAGGSTLRDYARPDGQLGYFVKDWRVYGREGQACPCGATVERQIHGGRSTFWCRACQR
jgi:formamidopyrimidine-DNA glycosylase